MPGIRRSSIRQAASFGCPDARNSSADAKASARNPVERRSLRVDFLTRSSSSTIKISAVSRFLFLVSIILPLRNAFRALHYIIKTLEFYSHLVEGRHYPLVEVDGDLKAVNPTQPFRHSNQI